MSKRFFVLLLLLAALITAATYLYTTETKETYLLNNSGDLWAIPR